ncbi:7921_t:CDS:2, partial [Racocetra persica]
KMLMAAPESSTVITGASLSLKSCKGATKASGTGCKGASFFGPLGGVWLMTGHRGLDRIQVGWLVGLFWWVDPDFGFDFKFSPTYNSVRSGLGGAVSIVK